MTLAAVIAACSAERSAKTQPDASAVREHAAEADAADDAARPSPGQLCSGCADHRPDHDDTRVRFHHVHLNVVDPAAAREFYVNVFAAEPVRLNGASDALWLSPMLFLFNRVQSMPDDTLEMGLDHVGRGSTDVMGWFARATQLGVMGDPRQGFQPTPMSIGGLTYVYLRGPGAERIEVYSAGTIVIADNTDASETFQHVHFLCPDVDTTVEWYSALLQLRANPSNGLGRDIVVDRVSLFFASYYQPSRFVPSDDRPMGHIAFSVSDLEAMHARAKLMGIEIVSEPAWSEDGFKSFFVRGPQQVLLEFVEASAIDR